MKAPIKTMRDKEIGSCKASWVPVYHKQHQSVMLKTREKLKWSNKTKLGGKQVLPCEVENDLTEHCLLMRRKFWGLTMADVHLAYQLAVRHGIKNQFCNRN